jgi:protein-S-isoprenylcysteine O-methyltransferase Ste14
MTATDSTICTKPSAVRAASMGASWRIGVDPSERTDLVTGGAFALVRNPIFSAMLLTGICRRDRAPGPTC